MKNLLTNNILRIGFCCLLLGGTVMLLSACGKRAEAAAPTLPTAEAPSLSERLSEEIQRDWQSWDGMNSMSQGISSKMPGSLRQCFLSWQEATDFLGFAPWNPLEEADWLKKMNTAGTDILSPGKTQIEHSEVRFSGDRDGVLSQVSLSAGYSEGDVRVILTADMIQRTTYSEDPGQAVSLSESISGKETRDGNDNYQAVNLYFDRENIFYSIRLIVVKGSAGGAAMEETYGKVLALIQETIGTESPEDSGQSSKETAKENEIRSGKETEAVNRETEQIETKAEEKDPAAQVTDISPTEQWETFGLNISPEEVPELLKDQDVVIQKDSTILAGRELLEQFYEKTQQGEEGSLLLAYCYTLENQRLGLEYFESEYDKYPQCFLAKLDYDGQSFHYVVRKSDSTEIENGDDVRAPILKRFTGDMPDASAYDCYVSYVLVNDGSVSWEQIRGGILSSDFHDQVPHRSIAWEYLTKEEEDAFAETAYYPTAEEFDIWCPLNDDAGSGRHFAKANLDSNMAARIFADIASGNQTVLGMIEGERVLWRVGLPYSVSSSQELSDGILLCGVQYIEDKRGIRPLWFYLEKYDRQGERLWQQISSADGISDQDLVLAEEKDGNTVCILQVYNSSSGQRDLTVRTVDAKGKTVRQTKVSIGTQSAAAVAFDGENVILALLSPYPEQKYSLVRMSPDGTLSEAGQIPAPAGKKLKVQDLFVKDGKLYVSAYACPGEEVQTSRHAEILPVLNQIRSGVLDQNGGEIPSEVLTPLVRSQYQAVLLEAALPGEGLPETGAYRTLFQMDGYLGGELSVNDLEELCWDILEPADLFYSPATSAFTIGGSCRILRYLYENDDLQAIMLTDRTAYFRR